MIELHDNECIRISETYAIIGTVEGMAALTGIAPQEAADNYRARKMSLVWTTIAPALGQGQPGHVERRRQHDSAVNLRNGQAVKIEDRFYTAAVTSGQLPMIRLVPHDLDEPGART